jgi:ABC-type glutathione transport system ATPase component
VPAARIDSTAHSTAPATASEEDAPVVHPTTTDQAAVIEIEHLSVDYAAGTDSVLHAVRDVSLVLHRGEILGLAGESGSGKSTLTNAVARLLRPPGEVVGGRVLFHHREPGKPVDVITMGRRDLDAFRWARLSVVFQSAMSSLNPVMRIGVQFDDVIRRHRRKMSGSARVERARLLLSRVSLDPSLLGRYPHELSGGMRQRVAIALALALQPDVIIMDEPTTALDMLVQRQILDEITELQRQDGFSIIFTTHDLSLLLEICDRIAVMRYGQLVEVGPVSDIQDRPQHEYTRALLQSLQQLGVSV